MKAEITRAQPRRSSTPSTHLGTVLAVESNYRLRVTIASGTITARATGANRLAQVGDTVQVTWQGGDPIVTDVITRRPPPTFTATGATLTRYAMNTAPPAAAITGTSPTVTKLIDETNLITSGTLSYDAGQFTPAHVSMINTLISRLNTVIGVVDDSREVLHGPSGTTGLKAGYSSIRGRTDDIQDAANTLRTNAIENRDVTATFLKTEGPKQGIAK